MNQEKDVRFSLRRVTYIQHRGRRHDASIYEWYAWIYFSVHILPCTEYETDRKSKCEDENAPQDPYHPSSRTYRAHSYRKDTSPIPNPRKNPAAKS